VLVLKCLGKWIFFAGECVLFLSQWHLSMCFKNKTKTWTFLEEAKAKIKGPSACISSPCNKGLFYLCQRKKNRLLHALPKSIHSWSLFGSYVGAMVWSMMIVNACIIGFFWATLFRNYLAFPIPIFNHFFLHTNFGYCVNVNYYKKNS